MKQVVLMLAILFCISFQMQAQLFEDMKRNEEEKKQPSQGLFIEPYAGYLFTATVVDKPGYNPNRVKLDFMQKLGHGPQVGAKFLYRYNKLRVGAGVQFFSLKGGVKYLERGYEVSTTEIYDRAVAINGYIEYLARFVDKSYLGFSIGAGYPIIVSSSADESSGKFMVEFGYINGFKIKERAYILWKMGFFVAGVSATQDPEDFMTPVVYGDRTYLGGSVTLGFAYQFLKQ